MAFAELRPYLIHEIDTASHTGVLYLEFFKLVFSQLKPRSYFEIGTNSGASLRQFECDAVCVDPAFKITEDVLLKRTKTFFFQMTSDQFFIQNDVRTFFPCGVDIGFLDGSHHFEILLRDFINFERFLSHKRSVLFLHDCLPTDLMMTTRTARLGLPWAGDVWRILPAFKKYRPDLRILLLDCPPTGLVVCYGLESSSNILQNNYGPIVDEYSKLVLDESGLRELWSLYPLVDTRRLAVENGGDIGLLFASISNALAVSRHPGK